MNRTLLVSLQSAEQSKNCKSTQFLVVGCRRRACRDLQAKEVQPLPAKWSFTTFRYGPRATGHVSVSKTFVSRVLLTLFARVRKSEKTSYLYYCRKKKKVKTVQKKDKAFLNQTTHCAKLSGIRAAQRKRCSDVEAPLTHSVRGFSLSPKEQYVERHSAPPSPSSLHRLETPPTPLASPSAPALWI